MARTKIPQNILNNLYGCATTRDFKSGKRIALKNLKYAFDEFQWAGVYIPEPYPGALQDLGKIIDGYKRTMSVKNWGR